MRQINITGDSEVLSVPCFSLYMSKTMVIETNEIIIGTIIKIKNGQVKYCEFLRFDVHTLLSWVGTTASLNWLLLA